MTRKKVKLAYIENESSRRVTYRKRVKGIVKKTQELSVLCDVDACAIIYGPGNQVPEVWPSSEEVRRIISDFKRKPEVDQSQKRFDQETFLKDTVHKAKEKLSKHQRRNRKMEIENVVSDVLSGKSTIEQVNPFDFGDLLYVIDNKMRAINQRIVVIEEGCDNINYPPPHLNDNVGVNQASCWHMEASSSNNHFG